MKTLLWSSSADVEYRSVESHRSNCGNPLIYELLETQMFSLAELWYEEFLRRQPNTVLKRMFNITSQPCFAAQNYMSMK